jgi:hypothetical protein
MIVSPLSYPIPNLPSKPNLPRKEVGSHAANFSIFHLDCLLAAVVLCNPQESSRDRLLHRRDGDMNHPFSLENFATTFSQHIKLHILEKELFP